MSFRPFRPTVEFSVSSRVKDTKLIYNSSQEKKKKKKKNISQFVNIGCRT